ncbi:MULTISPECIES: SCP2 sterol-binding domain-containing protein [Rhodopseudomonas]|uniref:Sterol-binding protein n=1 Tax=Rhodopseudomonas palustris TaxID=1076 RepID=A0A0D7F535_RHOPL|nr:MULTISPECIES: SCP2 sterol-binding domain-containing protein [Rhodopseudomonas]KIZ48224.1 sterol-binding protein [Rhodopseudomonas palustris]MDF3811744.1 SCP2 sterol-binding domain-containing protein [Rhodopseudomonas sp. BAL398]WOK17168.1 SCP2 sterol-binding domain-containing protein [Rhodopseudomonas sp. BAL398]
MSVSNPTVSRMPMPVALASRVLPLLPLQVMLGICLREIRGRHPRIFDRLGSNTGKRYGLDPTDLPLAFVLEPRRMNPKVTVVRSLPSRIDARIAGPLWALIGMTDGSYDGDALFFSRDIEIDGDMEAVVALRNAIDDSRVDFLSESVAWLGPLATPIERMLRAMVAPPAFSQDMGAGGGG